MNLPVKLLLANQGGAAFSPASISGYFADVDFATIANLWKDVTRTDPITADADEILGVTDSSGSGRHFRAAAAGSGFTYKTGILNGKSVGQSDGSDNQLYCVFSPAVALSQFYAIAVADVIGSLPADGCILQARNSADTQPILAILLVDGTWRARHRNNAGTLLTINSANTSAAPALVELLWDGSTLDMWKDGVSIITPTAATGTATIDTLALASYKVGASVGSFTNANNGRAIFYSAVPSTTERAALRAYLTALFF